MSQSHILRDYDTVREYTAVNREKAHGGSLDGLRHTVVDGVVCFNSGYGCGVGGAEMYCLLSQLPVCPPQERGLSRESCQL